MVELGNEMQLIAVASSQLIHGLAWKVDFNAHYIYSDMSVYIIRPYRYIETEMTTCYYSWHYIRLILKQLGGNNGQPIFSTGLWSPISILNALFWITIIRVIYSDEAATLWHDKLLLPFAKLYIT